MVSSRPPAPHTIQPGPIDPYVLFEALALTRRQMEQTSLPARPFAGTFNEEYEELQDFKPLRSGKMEEPTPDPQPENVNVGCINPFALAENMIGHKIDRQSAVAIRIVEDALQTDYEELFDMKHHSVLYAGLKLNEDERTAEELDESETRILKEKDLVTPDVSRLDRLGDLEELGIKEMDSMRIKRAGIFNNKLHLVLHAQSIARTVNNREVTQTINDFCLPFRRSEKQVPSQMSQSFTPPNSSWRDARDALVLPRRMGPGLGYSGSSSFFDYSGSMPESYHHHHHQQQQHLRRFDDPIQGATANSWFIAALFSVYWADPAKINRNINMMETPQMHMHMHGYQQVHHHHHHHHMSEDERRRQQHFRVKFHDKGGRTNNNKTMTVEVDYTIPVNNSSSDPVYCRSSDGRALWPALYEKAFAKWITGGDHHNNNSNNIKNSASMNLGLAVAMRGERIDVTKTHHGDPVKAMAQINGHEPEYFFTATHSAQDLVGLVRGCSVNQRVVWPMVAWTYATGQNNNNNNNNNNGGSNGGKNNNNNNKSRNNKRKYNKNKTRNNNKHKDGLEQQQDEGSSGAGTSGYEEREKEQHQHQSHQQQSHTYRGCDLVANHAYSVLGWCAVGQGERQQYIVVRNPWGVSEPYGVTSVAGGLLLKRLESEFWRPASLLDRGGVMAVEVAAFKEYFACLGVAR